MKPNLVMKSRFLLDNRGQIWTRSHSVNAQKTDEQLRYGKPKEATHTIGDVGYRFWVSYKSPEASEVEVYNSYLKAIGYKQFS